MIRKVKKKRSRIHLFIVFLLVGVFVAFGYKSIMTLGEQHMIEKEYDDKTPLHSSLKLPSAFSNNKTKPVTTSKLKLDHAISLSLDKLNSPNAILIRLKDHETIIQKNSKEKIYPASLTKMMTAIVAIENLPNLKEKIKLTDSTFQGLYGADASMAGFKPGERVEVIDLLYGALLPSGAECCIGLADQIAGSEQNFVKLMNQKATDLGMKNTHFENVTGLQNVNNYTTVKDLSILLSYALKNSTFRRIFTSSSHSTEPTNIHPDGITFYSTMFKELGNQSMIGGEILGGKTGYTDEAGLCLASLATVDKQEYILITAGAKGNHYSKQYHITDALYVYENIPK